VLALRVLEWIEDLTAPLEAIGADAPPAPRWNQDWFPRLDAAAAYAIVRKTHPRRIVEVGSGHSTRFLARAAADGELATQITSIDPAPRATLTGLPIRRFETRVENADIGLFQALGPGDILFIDSSHQVKPGSDVEFLLTHVLPQLRPDVRIHFHDIFLPDDYPAEWAWRRYNEQQAVASLLERGYALEFSSHQSREQALNGVLARLPLMPGARESSFWIRKR
jgi:hypothetical protein